MEATSVYELDAKICCRCRRLKWEDEYTKHIYGKDGLRGYCKACAAARASKYSLAYRDKAKNNRLIRRYNITLEEYKKILKSQFGGCAICTTNDSGNRSFAVDHCHKTGKIRGLLCVSCNRGLGNLKDSVDILNNAIDYLTRN